MLTKSEWIGLAALEIDKRVADLRWEDCMRMAFALAEHVRWLRPVARGRHRGCLRPHGYSTSRLALSSAQTRLRRTGGGSRPQGSPQARSVK